jgi:PPOX class probable F420-dependent enzyme
MFENERYISLETFKKDGTGVKTPVWSAPLDGKLIVFTDGNSYKVKRLRRNPRVRVAGCNASGRSIKTDWAEGTGRILEDAADKEKAHAALRKKYGWQMWLADVGSKLVGSNARRIFLELDLQSSSS